MNCSRCGTRTVCLISLYLQKVYHTKREITGAKGRWRHVAGRAAEGVAAIRGLVEREKLSYVIDDLLHPQSLQHVRASRCHPLLRVCEHL